MIGLPQVNVQSADVSPKLVLTSFGLEKLQAKKLNSGTESSDKNSAISYLGTPVFSNLVIEAGSYIDEDGNSIDYPGITINTVLFEATRPKTVIITNLQGRKDPIIEYISSNNYQVNIKLVLQGQGINIYPENEVKTLLQIMDVSDSIKVTSVFLNRLGIYNLVIMSHSLNDVEGYYNLQPFNISAISDSPIQLLGNNA